MPQSPTKLTPKQRKFVDEFVRHRDAAMAAVKAGYSKRNPAQSGYQLLNNPKVASVVEQRLATIATACDVEAQRVVQELARIAFADILEYVEYDPDEEVSLRVKALEEIRPGARAAIREIKEGKFGVELKLEPKMPALRELAKITGAVDEDPSTTNNFIILNDPIRHDQPVDVNEIVVQPEEDDDE